MNDAVQPAALTPAGYLSVPDKPAAGQPVDIAPFGTIRAWSGAAALPFGREHQRPGAENPTDWREHDLRPDADDFCWLPLPGYGSTPANIGIEWAEPRDVHAVTVQYRPDATPRPEEVDLQYWWWSWPTPPAEVGRFGWTLLDDKWFGYWKSADDRVTVNGTTHVHTFAALSTQEIAHAEGVSVPFRRTRKIRLVYPANVAAAIVRIRIFTASRWREINLRCDLGIDGATARWDGQVAVTNGVLLDVQPVDFDADDRLLSADRWELAVRGQPKGVRLHLLATDAGPDDGDRTIVTLRTAHHSCSFLTHDALDNGPIVVKGYGIRVQAVGDDARPGTESLPLEPTVIARVLQEPEQSFERAATEIPVLQKTKHETAGRRYVPLGADSNRQEFALQYNGNVFCDSKAMKPKPGDLDQIQWPGETIAYRFGTGEPPDFRDGEDAATQSVLDGCLPVVQTWWEQDGILYEEEAFATLLFDKLAPEGTKCGDEPAVLLVTFVARNVRPEPGMASIWFQVDPLEVLTLEEGAVLAVSDQSRAEGITYDRPRLRAQILAGEGTLEAMPLSGARSDTVRFRRSLRPGETAALTIAIPFITLTDPSAWLTVRALDYEAKRAEVVAYWRERIDAGAQIEVPEPTINAFYRAVIPHILISTDKDVPTGLSMNPAATYRYDVFANETCIQARMLDMRGYHDLARRYLEPFLYYQSVGVLPGRFASQRGVLHSAGPYTAAGYNLNHGWVLWTLAEHYWFTRDDQWLQRIAAHLVEGCNWIIQERMATRRLDAAGRRVPEYGLLPPGHLEDPVEWFHWYAVNAYAYRGLRAAAAVLAEIDHPDADRLAREAAAYREDVRASVQESTVLSPVVRLRDGSYVPHVPTRADIRGRDLGWIRDVLYGPTHLIDCGVFGPDESEAEWILQDHEDNLFLSEDRGLGAPGGNWFSLGGITHQPNLLNTPLIYLRRDQIPLALRALYNAFVASLYRDVNVFTEWLPTFGVGGGPFYKTPDEAAWIVWLRCLLVLEDNGRLWLGKGTPRRWLEHGQEIRVANAATHYGPVSFRIRSAVRDGVIAAEIDPPRRNPVPITLRLRHPEGRPIGVVTCNGARWPQYDPQGETIDLGTITQPVRLEVKY